MGSFLWDPATAMGWWGLSGVGMIFLDSDSQDYHRPYLAPAYWGGLGAQEHSSLAVLSTIHTADGSGIGRQCGFNPWLKTLIVEGIQSSLLIALLASCEEHIQHKSHCTLWSPSMGLHGGTSQPLPVQMQLPSRRHFTISYSAQQQKVTICLYEVPQKQS